VSVVRFRPWPPFNFNYLDQFQFSELDPLCQICAIDPARHLLQVVTAQKRPVKFRFRPNRELNGRFFCSVHGATGLSLSTLARTRRGTILWRCLEWGAKIP